VAEWLISKSDPKSVNHLALSKNKKVSLRS
jgi:hypothetical protein